MSEVVYYVGAHADDPLLFRGGVRWSDMHLAGVKCVHIITTAGDAGRTDGW